MSHLCNNCLNPCLTGRNNNPKEANRGVNKKQPKPKGKGGVNRT